MRNMVIRMSKRMLKTCKSASKKAFALCLAMMMILSCWIYVAPEESMAHAAGAADYSATDVANFESYVGADPGSATIESTYGKYFTDDSAIGSNAADLYKNVVWSGTASVVASVGSTKVRDDGALESFKVYYPATVLMYDGVTTPQFGISIIKDAKSDCKIEHWGTAMSGTNLSLVNDQWYGQAEGSANGKFFDAYNFGNYYCGHTSASKGSYDHTGNTGEWWYMANLIKYTGTMDANKYSETVTPSFSTHVGQPDGGNCKPATQVTVNLGTASVPVYIINTKNWNEAVAKAIGMYKTVSANENMYTAQSIADFKAYAKALLQTNPNNYSWSSDTASAVSSYSSAAKTAVTNMNSFTLVKKPLVIWKNYDGTVLASAYVEPGTTPSFSGATPTRPADEKYIYTFSGWSPAVGAVNADTTYTAQFSKVGNDGKVLFDNLIDIDSWNKTSANNASIIAVGDTGFCITSNEGVSEGTSSSPYFEVTPGKSYYVDVDIIGADWDVYFFFCDANGNHVSFSDSTNRFSSNGSGVASRTFTAPSGAVKGQIRVDANGSVSVVQVNSIRVFDASLGDKTLSVHNSQKVKYEAPYNTYGNLPTPTRTAYNFVSWILADGTEVDNDSIVNYAPVHTLFSKWTPVKYTITVDANGGNAVANKQFDVESGTMPSTTKANYDFVNWEVVTASGNWTVGDTYDANADFSGKYGDVTLKANWTPTVYTITVDENGGTTVADSTYTVESGTVPAAPTRTGYSFSHWEVVADSGNWTAQTRLVPGTTFTNKNGNIAIKAVWSSNGYVINLNLNKPAGAVTEPSCTADSITAYYDTAVGTLPVPTLDGYEFKGWHSTTVGGSKYTEDTVYSWTEDSTWYAVWAPVTYTIITDSNGGSEVADVTYTIENGTIPAGGELEGFWFSHWEVAENSGNWVKGTKYNPGDSAAGKYGNVTLKAVWAAKEYTVSFDLNDTAGVGAASVNKSTITVTFNQPLNYNEALPVATRNGYTFLGWFTADGTEVTADTIYNIEGSTTYYAHWEVVEYTITFDVNYGEALNSVTYTIEDELVLPVTTKTGNTFSYWMYLQATTGSWVRNTQYNADALNLGTGNWGSVTLKANYTVNEYEITWIINGTEEKTMHKFNTVPTHADPVVTDPYYTYVFKNWSPAISVVTGEATYTAVFEKTPKVYTVTWVDGDGNTVDTRPVAYGETVPTDVDVPVKTGYTVTWDYSGITTMPAGNLTIKAVYTPVKYAIHWEVEGVVIGTDMVDYDSLPSYTGETPEKAATPEYSYVFKGWTPAIVPVSGEATYVAEFTAVPQEYTITFVADNATVMSYKLAFGSAITVIPDVPEKIGSVGAWQGIPTTMPANDVIITAKYVKGALVTWYLDGTTDGASYQLGFENGEQIGYDRENPTKPADAEYTYTFEGWSTTPGGELISGYPVAGETDLAYYAVYSKTANVYTITWKADGNVVHTEEIAYGSAVSNIPAVPEKTGHTGVWKNIPATMPATDVTVNAEYTPKDYTITWVVGDEVYGTIFQYGTTPKFTGVTYKPSTETTDFTFAGWDKDITTVTGDETYTAVYTESARKYTVTWQYEDGTVIDTDTVANGSVITYIPAIANKTGYDAVYAIPEVMPTENVTIVVTYEAKSFTITWSTPAGDIEETWKYDETPVYDTDKYGVPTQEATAEKQFTFSGWTPVVSAVTGDTTYVATFSETARKYTVIWYVDGEFYDTRDVACGTNIPTLQVPEKTGYTGVWDNPYRTMPARDLEINAVYTAKKYTVYWKVDGLTVYSASVSYGAAIPSQKVPEKTGCTGVWANVPETMPAENVTINAEYTAKQFNVSWRMDGVTNTATATYGVDYVQTFAEGNRPAELKITIAGAVVGEDSYIYNAETGELRIIGSAIIGDVMIVARAAGGNCNLIANFFGGTSSNDVELIPERTAYFTQLVPATGYLLPSEVMVYVDGIYMNSGYTYDSTTGKLILNAEIVVGEIEIYAEFRENPNYNPGTGEEGGSGDSADCNCDCHSTSAFTKFFFKLLTFFRKLFGMDEYQYCGCGAAHW